MTSAAANPLQRRDRLERYRRLRAQLDPTGDPAHSIATAYVASPAALSQRVAGELALSPTSSHLLIGGIGSGKTTELLAVQAQLPRIDEEMHGVYIDVSKDNDVAQITCEQIMQTIGSAIASMASDPDAIDEANKILQLLAVGAPVSLKPLVTAIFPYGHVVVLLDGLDRLYDMQVFEQAVTRTVEGLHDLGVGVVVIGPLRALYGLDRAIAERFDSLHYQPWIDSDFSTEGQAFLVDVLSRRVGDDTFTADAIGALVHASGGVVRDLLALAQSACVEAYLDGADEVGMREIAAAVDTFGRKHMQGLWPAEIKVLQRVRANGSFVETSERDLALLMTRRVLEYRSENRPRYAVHPTIENLLAELAGR